MDFNNNTIYDTNKIRDGVISVFETDIQTLLGTKDWKARINVVKKVEGPPMKVIHWKTIQKLGYLPRYDECTEKGYTLSYEEAFTKSPKATTCFLSHRWLKPNLDPKLAHPDDESHTKAKAVIALGRYGENVYGNETYFWIDWCCINQDNSAPGALMLPLYTVCCDTMISFITEGYWDRGWCRAERAVFTATRSPRAWLFYPPGKVPKEESGFVTIEDPWEGLVSVAYDKELVRALSDLCKTIYERSYSLNFDHSNDYHSDNWNWFVTKKLEYGKTKAYYWCMNHYAGLKW